MAIPFLKLRRPSVRKGLIAGAIGGLSGGLAKAAAEAARLQAEAEGESGRGRGEKVRGTSQPKRRVPNSGPRRAGSPR